jgi:uncharacterized protein YqeY
MSLKTNIESGIKDAMRAKDQDRLRALRAIKSLILLEETSGNSTGELTTDAEMKILTKAAKQRKIQWKYSWRKVVVIWQKKNKLS